MYDLVIDALDEDEDHEDEEPQEPKPAIHGGTVH